MSLYNAINGFNPAGIFFLPMLGRRPEEYPRFRDCFLSDDEQHIEIYTRVGGNNRGCGYGEEKLYQDPHFVTTKDDSFDSTYATYTFNVPERWRDDFDRIANGEFDKVSDEYIKLLREFWPLLNEHGFFEKMFTKQGEE